MQILHLPRRVHCAYRTSLTSAIHRMGQNCYPVTCNPPSHHRESGLCPEEGRDPPRQLSEYECAESRTWEEKKREAKSEEFPDGLNQWTSRGTEGERERVKQAKSWGSVASFLDFLS